VGTLQGEVVDAVKIILPVPPSVNTMYFNVPGRGRVKTKEYSLWRTAAVAMIQAQTLREKRIEGHIAIRIYLPTKMRGDIDNRIKPLLDALVESKKIDDDKNVQSIIITKTRQEDDCMVCVEKA